MVNIPQSSKFQRHHFNCNLQANWAPPPNNSCYPRDRPPTFTDRNAVIHYQYSYFNTQHCANISLVCQQPVEQDKLSCILQPERKISAKLVQTWFQDNTQKKKKMQFQYNNTLYTKVNVNVLKGEVLSSYSISLNYNVFAWDTTNSHQHSHMYKTSLVPSHILRDSKC